MKNKKLFLPSMILAASILVTAVYLIINSIAQKPTITEGEFPFSITYELDGETVTINDVYKVHYISDDSDYGPDRYTYIGEIGNKGENNTVYTLKQDEYTRIELSTFFYPDHMMGDPDYDYFEDDVFEPKIFYYDAEGSEYYDEDSLLAQGVKLVSFEYPTPIENKFVFSHFSYFTGEIVLPMLGIAILALIATIIFVKKETKYKPIDIVSLVFNFIIGTVYLQFVTILAYLIDIEGGGPELYYQIVYFIPAVSVWCIAASVALRRKGYGVKSLIAEFIGPTVFALYLIVFYTARTF